MALVISFKDIFVDDESEQYDRLLQNGLDLVVRFLQTRAISLYLSGQPKLELTPLRPFLRLSSMNSDVYSCAFGLTLMKLWKACKTPTREDQSPYGKCKHNSTYIVQRGLNRLVFLECLFPHLVESVLKVQDFLHPSKRNVDSRCGGCGCSC